MDSFKKASFIFCGVDKINPLIYEIYHLSEEGSKIVFQHEHGEIDDTLPPLYISSRKSEKLFSLSKCNKLKTSTKLKYDMAYCEITEEELNYIEEKITVQLFSGYLCNGAINTDIFLKKLDMTKYPIFNITKFIRPNNTNVINSQTEVNLIANVTGSLKFYQNDGEFYTIIEVENNNANTSVLTICSAQVSYDKIESNFYCNLDVDSKSYNLQNLYLLPYSFLSKDPKVKIPFEVMIKDSIKAEVGYIPPRPNPQPSTLPVFSRYLEYSISLLLVIFLL